jgi:hypothetical protein
VGLGDGWGVDLGNGRGVGLGEGFGVTGRKEGCGDRLGAPRVVSRLMVVGAADMRESLLGGVAAS